MPFGNIADLKDCLGQELPWQGVDLLAMLHRTGGMIGDGVVTFSVGLPFRDFSRNH
jgi:hypothetical protein